VFWIPAIPAGMTSLGVFVYKDKLLSLGSIKMRGIVSISKNKVPLVPKLLLGNAVLEALASIHAKLELRRLRSQAGAWERANLLLPE